MIAEHDAYHTDDEHIKKALEQPTQEQARATLREQQERSTRDYFAGQIASGMLADIRVKMDDFRHRIGEVFDLADEMLAESKRRGGW